MTDTRNMDTAVSRAFWRFVARVGRGASPKRVREFRRASAIAVHGMAGSEIAPHDAPEAVPCDCGQPRSAAVHAPREEKP